MRDNEAFYNRSFPFAEMQKHPEILEHWDFGFAHQVLSFSRRDNESILRSLKPFAPSYLLRYIFVRRYSGVERTRDTPMELSSNDNGLGIAVAAVKSGNDNNAGPALLEKTK